MDKNALMAKLHELYADQSKHSVYQNIPEFVRKSVGYTETIDEHWRGDSARWEYMRNCMDFSNKSILDVGANTGFFTLSLADKYPESICTALEGNVNHAEFIRMIAAQFSMENVRTLPQYLSFAALDTLGEYDMVLLYNVLHHAGVDFDNDLVPTKEYLFSYLVQYMTKLRERCSQVVFQMGYNWGGNKQQPVVDLQDDAGKFVYTARLLRSAGWTIRAIANSCKREGDIPVIHKNLPRDVVDAANACDEAIFRMRLGELLDPALDTLSEFYRRPIFVCARGKCNL